MRGDAWVAVSRLWRCAGAAAGGGDQPGSRVQRHPSSFCLTINATQTVYRVSLNFHLVVDCQAHTDLLVALVSLTRGITDLNE